MATETESTVEALAQLFREHTADWNSTAQQRDSTRKALTSTCGEIVRLVGNATGSKEVAGTAGGGVLFLASAIPMLIEQIGQLEARVAALEAE